MRYHHLPLCFVTSIICLLQSCSPSRFIGKEARAKVIKNKALAAAHIGISIYDAEKGRYLYNYNGDKYFVPASNVKLATCYAAMKYLGDSLVGLRYKIGTWNDGVETDTAILVEPTGDPTFLHPDFKEQKAYTLLKGIPYKIRFLRPLSGHNYYGKGWAWDDTRDSYMPQLSFFPVYGNVATFQFRNGILEDTKPAYFEKRKALYFAGTGTAPNVTRFMDRNVFEIIQAPDQIAASKNVVIPFLLEDENIPQNLIADTLHKIVKNAFTDILMHRSEVKDEDIFKKKYMGLQVFYSQPTDSLLKPMMHRSDNFFAEQSLLMAANEHTGIMNTEKIIDTLLKTDLAGLPQQPHWVDGSGLSRYNLFSPQDFIFVLNKMRQEFGLERMKNMLPTGSEGTLSNYYLTDRNQLWAKTGTLSGVVALSGFMYTQKGKLLLFSVQVNNHVTSATTVRRAVESFIQSVRGLP